MKSFFTALSLVVPTLAACAGQAPYSDQKASVPVSRHDRVYTADQFSNTVSVIDPASNKLLGVIKLGDPTPRNLSPLYRGQLLVHGLGFSPDGRTLAVVSIGSNSVSFIDTATNTVKHVTYVGRSPHEAFFSPDGREVWVSIRGENYIQVLDGMTYQEKQRIEVPNGPGMAIFAPNGKYAYVCSSFTPETVVISATEHRIVGRVKQPSRFCPNIAATPDGKQVWFTLKDVGQTVVFGANPPFSVLKVLDTGPITNHVNIARDGKGQFAYVTVGGENKVKVFRTDTFEQVGEIDTGDLPHGVWPSGDGTRVYVGVENGDSVAAIETGANQLIATIPVGHAPQAIVYVPNAVPTGNGLSNLDSRQSLGQAVQLTLAAKDGKPAARVTLFDQGPVQILQAAVTGLEPKKEYVLALSADPQGRGQLEPLAPIMAGPGGTAVANSIGPIRQVVGTHVQEQRRYLVIATGTPKNVGAPVQFQILR
jgi:YVTN family beta-propeller protein